MSLYEHHIFVCLNERPSDHPKGCCQGRGSEALLDAFRTELLARGLKGKVRANKAGCLDLCAHGPTVVIYPEAVWYAKVEASDVPEIVDAMAKHLKVDRLLLHKEPRSE